ncbi:PD-(D/E)XK nuclease family protein, partial [Streptomyces sp. NPDC059104]|uniref:PD-(D/E)XK nuclease family protein n=1 Tax=Streptomyces sp. NPDC059104 TaxID=3346729 RepID=UPI00369B2072
SPSDGLRADGAVPLPAVPADAEDPWAAEPWAGDTTPSPSDGLRAGGAVPLPAVPADAEDRWAAEPWAGDTTPSPSDGLRADGAVPLPAVPADAEDPWAAEPWAGVPGSAVPGARAGTGAAPDAGEYGQAAHPDAEDPWAGVPGARVRPAAELPPPAGPADGDEPRPAPTDGSGGLWAGEDARPAGAPARLPAPRRGPAAPHHPEGTRPPTPEEARAIASWDRDLDALEGELRRARAAVRDVELPSALSASQLMRLAADEQGFVRDLARPMPRPPQPAARQGTRFHAWVESRFEELPLPLLDLLDPATELPGSDQEVADEADLDALKAAFERSEYAERTPYRMEAPVQLTLAGRVIRGRIDAVYKNPDGSYEVVDWKTGRTTQADPLQLAVYRLAWSEATGTPLDRVSAAFLHVRSGRVIRPRDLPGRARLERILQGETGTDGDAQADG